MSSLPTAIGRYEVQQRLGQGGMGVIYLARDPAIDRLVAVKLLNADIASEELRQRFAQEARSSGALTHPNIVTLHDFGEVDGVPYLVMEYVQGETMAALIKRTAQIPIGLKLRWIEQACRALGYAHQRRVIHRDVKPSNLMIDELETLKVVDFGIARSLDGGTTKLSMVIGTPGYMSPEQIQGGSIDARSDVFALGTVLYELLTYREAFGADSPHAVMLRVVGGQPQALANLLTGPDLSIAAIVDKALQKSPDARFQDMAQFESAVQQARTALESTGRELTMRTPRRRPNDRNQSLRRRTDPVDLARRRAEQIAGYLDQARQARQAGDFEAATTACENALLMDPSLIEALDLLDEMRQEPTGVSPRLTAPITAVATTAIAQPPAPPARARPVADLSQLELRPAIFAERSPGPEAGSATVVVPPSPRRRAWPWAAMAGLVATAAAGLLAVQAGVITLDDGEELSAPAPELALPDIPQATTPPPSATAAPSARPAASDSRAASMPDAPSEPGKPAASGTAPEESATDEGSSESAVEPPRGATTTPAPAPPDVPTTDASTEPPQAAALEPLPAATPEATDAPDGPVDREAVMRLLLRADGAERNGNLQTALSLYREVLTVEPGNGLASRGVIRTRVAQLLRRAESLVLIGDYPAALKELAAIGAYDPTNARAEELREAIEQGRVQATPKKPGPD